MLLCCNLFRPSFLPSVPVLIFPVTLFNKSNLATINNCLEWVGGWVEGGLFHTSLPQWEGSQGGRKVDLLILLLLYISCI